MSNPSKGNESWKKRWEDILQMTLANPVPQAEKEKHIADFAVKLSKAVERLDSKKVTNRSKGILVRPVIIGDASEADLNGNNGGIEGMMEDFDTEEEDDEDDSADEDGTYDGLEKAISESDKVSQL